jgi:hypothetical protein
VNSNPATIMTDPEFAHRTYVEPLTVDVLERIIAAERPDAVLPTIGGQTGLNLALDLAEAGILEKYGCELIGAKVDAIKRAEDRDLFKSTMRSIGLNVPKSGVVHTLEDAEKVREEIGLPVIIRPSRTLGGSTYKLKFGHHGGNQPVQDLTTGKVEITAQNHGFAVDPESLKDRAEVTHVNLNDKTVEGLVVKGQPTFSVQYHPEASPGPHDARYLFRRFVDRMEKR